jgi:hypothetical protein
VPELVELLESGNIYDKHKAIMGLRKLTLQIENMLDLVPDQRRMMEHLVSFCDQDEFLQLKFLALWTLTNLSSCTKEASKL